MRGVRGAARGVARGVQKSVRGCRDYFAEVLQVVASIIQPEVTGSRITCCVKGLCPLRVDLKDPRCLFVCFVSDCSVAALVIN